MPATFSAALAELTALRSGLAIVRAGDADRNGIGARCLIDAIEELEAKLGVNQVRL
jgi:hypothetical protein